MTLGPRDPTAQRSTATAERRGGLPDLSAHLRERLRAGEEQAVREASLLALPQVQRWVRRIARHRARWRDLEQDAMVRVMSELPTLGEGSFWVFVFKHTRNAVRKDYRFWRRWGFEQLPADLSKGPAAEGRTAALELLELALAQLSQPERELIILSEVEERTQEEICALLGVSRGTVVKRLSKARHKLALVAQAHGLRLGGGDG